MHYMRLAVGYKLSWGWTWPDVPRSQQRPQVAGAGCHFIVRCPRLPNPATSSTMRLTHQSHNVHHASQSHGMAILDQSQLPWRRMQLATGTSSTGAMPTSSSRTGTTWTGSSLSSSAPPAYWSWVAGSATPCSHWQRLTQEPGCMPVILRPLPFECCSSTRCTEDG